MRRRTPLGGWTIAGLSAAAVTGSLLVPVSGAFALAPAAAPAPVADLLDVDFRDGSAVDHAQGQRPTLFGDPEVVADVQRATTAMQFDGDDAALYAMTDQFAEMSTSFTIECSFRYDGTDLSGGEQDICGAKQAGGLATTVSRGNFNFMAHIGGDYRSIQAPIEADTWYHTVVVWDGSELVAYVDGVEVGRTAATGAFKPPIEGARNLALGGDAEPGGGTNFHAATTIDTARVYSAALTAAEVATLAEAADTVPVAPTADVLDVDFSDGGPTDHAQGLPATTWGDPVIRDDAPLNRKVGAFDGKSAFLYPLAEQYDDLPASGEERGNLCGAKEAGGFSVTLYGDKLSFNPHVGGSYRNIQTPVESDRWYHVVGNFDGDSVELWLDGVKVREVETTGQLTVPPNATAHNLVVGGDASTNNRAQFMAPATIAATRLFSEPLDADDVMGLRHDVLAEGLSSDPVQITGSTPAADSRITSATTLSVDTNLPGAVGRKVEYRLDGALVRPGDLVGPGLSAGDHTVTMQGKDVFGRPIDDSFSFRSANIPVDGGTETGQGNGTTTLSSVATNPSGGDVTTTFVEAEVKVADAGFQGTVDQLPTTLDFTYQQGEELETPLRPDVNSSPALPPPASPSSATTSRSAAARASASCGTARSTRPAASACGRGTARSGRCSTPHAARLREPSGSPPRCGRATGTVTSFPCW